MQETVIYSAHPTSLLFKSAWLGLQLEKWKVRVVFSAIVNTLSLYLTSVLNFMIFRIFFALNIFSEMTPE